MDKNMIRPFFSIIQPVYNLSKDLLSRSIGSVLSQEFKNWELLIIVDGTCPDLDYLSHLTADARIKTHFLKHSGVSVARNFGLNQADGLYVCFLDGDDQYLPSHLACLNQNLEKQQNPICLTRTGMIHQYKNQPTKTGLYNPIDWRSPAHFFLTTFYGIITICVHHSITKSLRFAEESKYLEDTDFIIRIIMHYPFVQIAAYTTIAYAHPAQSSNQIYLSKRPEALAEEAISTLKNIYSRGGEKLLAHLPQGFDQLHVSTKYLQYANGCLENYKLRSSLALFIKSVTFPLIWFKTLPYIKYVVKFPYYLLRSVMCFGQKCPNYNPSE